MARDEQQHRRNHPTPSLFDVEIPEHLTIQELIPQGRLLYYPCSGQDTGFCINEFGNQIDAFWFADICYARQFNRNSRERFLTLGPLWELHSQPIAFGRTSDGIAFPLRKIELVHRRSKKKIEAVFMSVDAVRVFVELERGKKELSVFVHRADGVGEGGSSLSWLNQEHADPDSQGFLDRVVRRMEPCGWIVSDGANSSPFFRSESPKPFDFGDRRLVPIGKVPPRNGPTWIWRVEENHGKNRG